MLVGVIVGICIWIEIVECLLYTVIVLMIDRASLLLRIFCDLLAKLSLFETVIKETSYKNVYLYVKQEEEAIKLCICMNSVLLFSL
jgi:hypothetical protein